MLSSNQTLLTKEATSKMLGINSRALDYWRKLKIGPVPFIIAGFDGSRHRILFAEEEIQELVKDHERLNKLKNLYSQRMKESGLADTKKNKPVFD